MTWPTGVQTATNVTLEELTATPSNGTRRREECHLSSDLIQSLGLVRDPELGSNWGQIRVIHEDSDHAATFTVAGEITGSTSLIRVYPTDGSDEGGILKLTGESTTPTNLGQVTVHGFVPARSSVIRATTADLDSTWFTEAAGRSFIEGSWESGDNQVVLLVPHGGSIELRTSDMVTPFRDRMDGCSANVSTALWECRGTYENAPHNTHTQWHTTSIEIQPRSFPALAELLDLTPQWNGTNGIHFRYAVSFHGFRGTTGDRQIILGGRMSRSDKETVRDAIRSRLPGSLRNTVDICIALAQAGSNTATAHPNNSPDCPGNHAGVHEDNIVNRLSANPDVVDGHGGLQVEMSLAAREVDPNATTQVYEYIAEGVADGICELIRL